MTLPLFTKKMIFGYKATGQTYLNALKKNGAVIGEDVNIYCPRETFISLNEAYLLEIGNHVNMTGPMTILFHDYSWSVIKRKYGFIYGNQKPVTIGNNVFIGWGATILCGSVIEDNTIIGANAVVSGHLIGNTVYVGNPAQKLMSLDEYTEKRKNKQLEEAVALVLQYEKRFGTQPDKSLMGEYFFLFETGRAKMIPRFEFQLGLMDTYDKSIELLYNLQPMFNSYAEFLNYCERQKK